MQVDFIERIPEELRGRKQWLVWAYEDRGEEKPTKIPCRPFDAKRRKASSVNPDSWGTFDQAVACWRTSVKGGKPVYAGIGFVFTKDDPYVGIDLDHCIRTESNHRGTEDTEAGGERDIALSGRNPVRPVDASRQVIEGTEAGTGPEPGATLTPALSQQQERGSVWSRVADWAKEIVHLFPGAYVEVSPSGTGLHLIIRGTKTDKRCKKVGYGGTSGDVEVYDSGRFFCVTGNCIQEPGARSQEPEAGPEGTPHHRGTEDTEAGGGRDIALSGRNPVRPVDASREVIESTEGMEGTETGSRQDAGATIPDLSEQLVTLFGWLFPPEESKTGRTGTTGRTPDRELPPGAPTDDELLALAANAKNGDAFMRLWGGDTSEYGGDDSKADFHLCCHLAFWTNKDPERMDRLFRLSGLMRPKWERGRGDYAQRTIQAAIEQTSEGYKPRTSHHRGTEDTEGEGKRSSSGSASGQRGSASRDGQRGRRGDGEHGARPGERPTSTGEPDAGAGAELPSPQPLSRDDVPLAGATTPNNGRGSQPAVVRPYTDLGNAERLIDAHGEDLRFNVDSGKWLIWDGRRWCEDHTFQVDQFAAEVIRGLLDLRKEFKGANRALLFKHADKSEQLARLNAMVELARERPGTPVRAVDLDADPWLLNCENGILNLRTGDLLPHDRRALCTKLVAAPFDPLAECPRWMQFLQEVFAGDKGLATFMQRWLGYSLTGITREQCFVLTTGKGSNGKSVFVGVVMGLLGDYAQSTPATTFTEDRSKDNTSDLADLVGARLVTAVEMEETGSLGEGLVKRMTGGDPIKCRHMYHGWFSYLPTFKIFFATNEVPRIRSQNHAMKRRVLLVPWNVKFYEPHELQKPQVDKELPEKLRAEFPGILAWAVRGCLDWQREGLGVPPSMRAEVTTLFDSMDVLREWIEACCDLHPGAETTPDKLWKSYVTWCEMSDVSQIYKQKHSFTRNLYHRDGIEAGRTSSRRFVRGICIKGEPINRSMTLDDANSGFSGNLPSNSLVEDFPGNGPLASLSVIPPDNPPVSEDWDSYEFGGDDE